MIHYVGNLCISLLRFALVFLGALGVAPAGLTAQSDDFESALGWAGSRGGARGLATEWADIDAMMRPEQQVLLLATVPGGGEIDGR